MSFKNLTMQFHQGYSADPHVSKTANKRYETSYLYILSNSILFKKCIEC